jgi:hypothetical protein
VEKDKDISRTEKTPTPAPAVLDARPERPQKVGDEDDWMGIDSMIPTYSNDWKKEKRKTKKDWEKLRSTDMVRIMNKKEMKRVRVRVKNTLKYYCHYHLLPYF